MFPDRLLHRIRGDKKICQMKQPPPGDEDRTKKTGELTPPEKAAVFARTGF